MIESISEMAGRYRAQAKTLEVVGDTRMADLFHDVADELFTIMAEEVHYDA